MRPMAFPDPGAFRYLSLATSSSARPPETGVRIPIGSRLATIRPSGFPQRNATNGIPRPWGVSLSISGYFLVSTAARNRSSDSDRIKASDYSAKWIPTAKCDQWHSQTLGRFVIYLWLLPRQHGRQKPEFGFRSDQG